MRNVVAVSQKIEVTPEGLVTAINSSVDNTRPILQIINQHDVGSTSVQHQRPFLRSRGNINLAILDDGSLISGERGVPHNIAIYYAKDDGKKLTDGRIREEVTVGVDDEKDTHMMIEVDASSLMGHPAVKGLPEGATGKVRFNYFTVSTSGETDEPESRVQAVGFLLTDTDKKGPKVIFSDLEEPLSKVTDKNDTQGHNIRAKIIGAFDRITDALLKGVRSSTETSQSAEYGLLKPSIVAIRGKLEAGGHL